MSFNNFSFKKAQNIVIPKELKKFVDNSATTKVSENTRTYYANVDDYSDIMPLKRPKGIGELYDEGLDWEEPQIKIKKKN